MAQAATFNDEIYRALRDSGMEERYAMRAARAVPPADSLATKADLADLRAAMPERENIAAKSDVAVLQNEMTDVKAAIVRIDKSIERINEKLAHMDKRIDVVEEKISSIRTLLFVIYTPLLLLILASQFGILTRGLLWAVAP